MEEIETGSFLSAADSCAPGHAIRVISWNINRGEQLDGVLEFLRRTPADLILLQETDVNARRTQHRNVAREIAQALRMNYVFGCEFEELAQGNRNSPAYHGQATLSRMPISESRILRFSRQSGFWRPRWYIPNNSQFQRRLGARMALVSQISWLETQLILYNVHLESRSDDALRCIQLAEILEDTQRYESASPIIVAGDFNFDLSQPPAASLLADLASQQPIPKRLCSSDHNAVSTGPCSNDRLDIDTRPVSLSSVRSCTTPFLLRTTTRCHSP